MFRERTHTLEYALVFHTSGAGLGVCMAELHSHDVGAIPIRPGMKLRGSPDQRL
jgi:hypothetical protein